MTTSCSSAGRPSTRSSARRSARTPTAGMRQSPSRLRRASSPRDAPPTRRLPKAVGGMSSDRGALVIACGALAREIAALRRVNGWSQLDVCYLPPELHKRPERIVAAIQEEIRAHRDRYETIFVAYGDCGTGGGLDAM